VKRPNEPRRFRLEHSDPRHIAGDVDREIAFHLDYSVQELIATGLSPQAAREEALRLFGDVDATSAECASVRTRHFHQKARSEMIHDLVQDLRFGVRMLRRSPGFAAVAILTLALGIGANTAILGAVNAVLIRPLPFAKPGQLASAALSPGRSVSKAGYAALRGRVPGFEDVAAYSGWGFALTGGGAPEILDGAVTSGNLFAVLGRAPFRGRTLQAGDDRPGAPRVVVLSYGFWQRRFGGDEKAIGSALTLNGTAHTVVGVMPQDFFFPVHGAELWAAIQLDPADTGDYTAGYLSLVGRLRPAIEPTTATSQLRAAAAQVAADNPDRFSKRFGSDAVVSSFRDQFAAPVKPALLLLLGAVAFVLLIACANVANLLLGRAVARQRELELRAALGASRSRIVQQLLTESVLLALAGATAGVALAFALLRAGNSALPASLVRAGGVSLDLRALTIAVAASLLVGIAFGLVPARAAFRRKSFTTLREGTRSQSRGRAGQRTMRALIVGEIAIAMVLTVGAALLLQSFAHLRSEQIGYQTDGILAVFVAPPDAEYVEPARRIAYLRTVTERIGAIAGVTDVGAIHLLPFSGNNWNPEIVIEGRVRPADGRLPEVDWRVVTPGYFTTVSVGVVKGRSFSSDDRPDGPAVALINATAARTLFAGTDPIGKRVRTFFEGKGNWATIVGVISDTQDQQLGGAARPQMFRPFSQHPVNGMALMVRTRGDPARMASLIREAVWSVDRNVPIERAEPMRDIVERSIAPERLTTSLLAAFGGLALMLGAVGIYGVMSYSVAQRGTEIGVRLAIGAVPADVLRLVLRDAFLLTGAGLGVGALGAIGLSRLLSGRLYGIQPTDVTTFGFAAVVLGGVAIAASAIPAWRASRLDPAMTLRAG
jgi:putative ABC transport system permease protein